MLITIIIVIVIVILANLGSYAHHRYRHCYSYRLILFPLLTIANVVQHLWRPIPFPPLSDVQFQCRIQSHFWNIPTIGDFRQFVFQCNIFGKRLIKSRLQKLDAIVCLV